MNSMKKMLTSALVISGATATVSALEVEAAQYEYTSDLEEDTEDLSDLDIIEDALRQFVNPLQRVHNYLEHYQPEDYIMYEVKAGDTISGISVQFGIPEAEIVRENQINNKHRISIGEKLQIRLKEQHYFVQHGESLEEIAQQKEVSVEEIIAYNRELQEAGTITYPGQHLKIPTAAPEPAYQPLSAPRKSKVLMASRSDTSTLREITGLSWPVNGTITSSFGPRWGRMHNGMDIASSEKSRAAIQAAKDGVVLEAYFHRGGYGNLIILDHGQGVQTYYAHLSKFEVKAGDEVRQGDVIGYMGSTGRSTGYHLHFEIRKDNKPLNPIKYLPAQQALR